MLHFYCFIKRRKPVKCSFQSSAQFINRSDINCQTNNSDKIQDEVLAHRLGLIPLKANPQLFEYKSNGTGDDGVDKDTLEFKLKVKVVDAKRKMR